MPNNLLNYKDKYMYKAVIFDIGQTLIQYNKPLNWNAFYRPALEYMAAGCERPISEVQTDAACEVLTKYNTRVNPRENEVSSDTIFREIFKQCGWPKEDIFRAKEYFYSFFRRDAFPFPEAENVLIRLKLAGIKTGTLSDVAYGMDNVYALADLSSIRDYIDLPLTSNDVGYRKPNTNGLKFLAQKWSVQMSEMIYVGDEEKDIICANRAGVYSVLVNRSTKTKCYGENMQITSLSDLLETVLGQSYKI